MDGHQRSADCQLLTKKPKPKQKKHTTKPKSPKQANQPTTESHCSKAKSIPENYFYSFYFQWL